MVDEFYYEIGHIVREVRIKRGLDRAELAKQAHVTRHVIDWLESGDDRAMSTTLATIHKLAVALDITFYWSFMDQEDWDLWAEWDVIESRRKQRKLSGLHRYGAKSENKKKRRKRRKKRKEST